jgi:CRISPR-associated protein Cmr6
MQSRRRALAAQLTADQSHPGLWLDKYISSQERDDTETRKTLVDDVARIKTPAWYAHFFEQWKLHLHTYGATMREATVDGRMVVGLGNESVLETSVTLHRTYGVPLIPGSAIKGLAVSYARQHLGEEWKQGGWAHTTAFGTTESAGYITFFDALYVPGSGAGKNGQVLAPDVIAVHHPQYYRDANHAPADWDSPIPIPFLTATGTYMLALAGDQEWVTAMFTVLGYALQEMGIGAKTSSGYGRLKLQQPSEQGSTAHPPDDPEQQQVQPLLERLAALPQGRVATELNTFVKEWRSLGVRTELRQQVARAILDKVREAGREKKSATKPWFQELVASLEQTEDPS